MGYNPHEEVDRFDGDWSDLTFIVARTTFLLSSPTFNWPDANQFGSIFAGSLRHPILTLAAPVFTFEQ
jgi:hypothetical protein